MAYANAHDSLPADAKVCHLAGDHMHNGYIDNSDRPQRLEVIVRGGQIFEVDYRGDIDFSAPMVIDADGSLEIGAGWTFAPEAGELKRVRA